jgi:adenylate cyclase
MPDARKTLGHWIAELRRRKVFRVAIAYALVAWVLVQVADATFEPLGLPTIALRLLIVALALGFPLACVLAWAFDVTPHGLERTAAADVATPSLSPAVVTPPAAVASMPASTTTTGTAPHAASVAVLPFVDLSQARDQEYFCDGIAEEIINSLCCVRGLRVASRTSSFQFRGRQQDVREIGRALGVSSVLEGSVRKAGERVRITAQLVSCADGYHHWSESFDRKLDDVFQIQTEIARQLVRALRLTLTPEEKALLGRSGTANAEAYDLYLRGQALLRDLTDHALPRAVVAFRQAIERDPTFAQAHAGLANAIAVKGQWRLDLTLEEFDEAIRASQRALDLQPHMPEAWLAKASLLSMQGRGEQAERAFDEAMRLNPASYETNYMYARHCFAQGDFERAAQLFEAAHRLRPDEYQPLCMWEGALAKLGRHAQEMEVNVRAIAAIEARLAIEPDDGRALHLGAIAFAKIGDAAKTREYARRAVLARPGEFATAYNLACAYSRLGDREEALRLLDDAVRYGRGNFGWIEHDPDLENLRDDPRFHDIVDRLRRAGQDVGTVAGVRR